MRCNFVAIDAEPKSRLHCATCGYTTRPTIVKPERYVRECSTDWQKSECPHRKELLRLEPCEGCRGEVKIKVFACERYGECTISKAIPGVHVCDGGGG